jgi:hypothetical protein
MSSSSLTAKWSGKRMADLSIDAEIDLLPTERGGRRRPILNGFRPALWFGDTGPTGEPELHSAIVRLKRGNHLDPGKRGAVLIAPVAYETWPRLREGAHFDVYDAGRSIGSGVLATAPGKLFAEPELRRAVGSAFEQWAIDRFGDRVERAPRLGTPLEPDVIARFTDADGTVHVLVAEIVARRPVIRDVERLARMMERTNASLGWIVASDSPSPHALDAIYRHGTVALAPGVSTPRIRVVTSRDLARNTIDLLPAKQAPDELVVRS